MVKSEGWQNLEMGNTSDKRAIRAMSCQSVHEKAEIHIDMARIPDYDE